MKNYMIILFLMFFCSTSFAANNIVVAPPGWNGKLNGIQDAPIDGQPYLRSNGVWSVYTAPTMPPVKSNYPYFWVDKGGVSQSISSSDTKLTYTNIVFNGGGNYSTNLSRWNPTVTGKYVVGCYIQAAAGGGNDSGYVQLYRNGTAIDRGYLGLNGSVSYYRTTFINMLQVGSTGDYFEIYVKFGTGVNISGITNETFWWAYKLAE